MAVTQAGVYTWGWIKYGQLGYGVPPALLATCTTPKYVPGLQDVRIVQVFAEQFHTVCIDTCGRVFT